MRNGPVRIERERDIAIVVIDHPPANALTSAVRLGLLDAVAIADRDPEIAGIVLIGAGMRFVGASEPDELAAPPRPPHLPDVITRIEATMKPVVVAWAGAVRGGGCEIGLGAHYRIISPDATLGLPDIRLGLLPAAGGTQRLPRLVGLPAALDLIASGRSIDAREAFAIGLVDAVASGDLRDEAVAAARHLAGGAISRLSVREPPPPDPGQWREAVARVKRDARGRIAPLKAIDLVQQTATLPFRNGQPVERQVFYELLGSAQSLALRHLAIAEREARRVPGLEGSVARRIERLGLVGAGPSAVALAALALDRGLAVTLHDPSVPTLRQAAARIESARRATSPLPEGRFIGSAKASELLPCDAVIETQADDATTRAGALAAIEAVLKPDTLLASLAAGGDLEGLALGLKRPGRFLGLHFFAPLARTKVAEVARLGLTRPDVWATGLGLVERLGKVAVACRAGEGLAGGRVLARFRAECEALLLEGAFPHEVDGALEAYGLALGPFAAQDLAGLDIAWTRRRRERARRGGELPGEAPFLDRLCELGRTGQKAGRGWYLYGNGARAPDPDVDRLILAHLAQLNRKRRSFSEEEIQHRALAAMVNEGARLVDEGVVARPLEIDVVMVLGYGFPAWRGGPMQEADRIGLNALLAVARAQAERTGMELSALFARLAASGRTFASLNMAQGAKP